jgi:predicted ester cyclase
MERSRFEELANRWATEAVARGRVEVFDTLLTEDALDHSGSSPTVGVEPFKARTRALQGAFSDIEVVVDALLVDGDRMAWRWTLTGVHHGAFLGIAPTGRRVTLKGMNVQRIAKGRVAEHWSLADQLGLLSSLRRSDDGHAR